MQKPWFRFYRDALNNPKVQKLSGDDFKFWVNVLCIADENTGELPPMDEICFLLRETESSVSLAFHRLQKNELIETVNGNKTETFHIHNWQKRQYKSDTSTERVKRHRKRKRNVSRNVSVTPQIQNRTDIDNKPPIDPPLPKTNGATPPAPRAKARRRKTQIQDNFPDENALNAAREFWTKSDRQDLDATIEAERFRDHAQANGKTYLDWSAAWRTWYKNAIRFSRAPTTSKAPWEQEAANERKKLRRIVDDL